MSHQPKQNDTISTSHYRYSFIIAMIHLTITLFLFGLFLSCLFWVMLSVVMSLDRYVSWYQVTTGFPLMILVSVLAGFSFFDAKQHTWRLSWSLRRPLCIFGIIVGFGLILITFVAYPHVLQWADKIIHFDFNFQSDSIFDKLPFLLAKCAQYSVYWFPLLIFIGGVFSGIALAGWSGYKLVKREIGHQPKQNDTV